MPGFVGGRTDGDTLAAMLEVGSYEPWYGTERAVRDGRSLGLVHHGETGAGTDHRWYVDDDVLGAISGTVIRTPDGVDGPEELFRAVLERPAETLAGTEGLFSIACVDPAGDRIVLATDRVGSRPVFYTEEAGFLFASELKSLATALPDPQVDTRAISDLLLLGHPWGETTLLAEASSLRPARVLVSEGGDVSVERYWRPAFDAAPEPGRNGHADAYPDELMTAYRGSVRDVANSMDGRVGLWLSGGLDSRILGGVLADEVGDLRSMTYHVPGRRDPGPARRVAETLGTEHDTMTLGPPDAFADVLERAIWLTDGMTAWSYLVNTVDMLTGLRDRVDYAIEAAPHDTYFGHDLWDVDRRAIRRGSVGEALFRRYGRVDPGVVSALLPGVDDPRATIEREATEGTAFRGENAFRDVVWQSLSYSHFRSSRVPRSQVGTRVPCATGDVLDTAAARPRSYDRKSVPLAPGRVPRATTALKFDMIRELDSGLDRIPYELTGLPPSYPQWLHTIGMAAVEVRSRLRSEEWYDDWYRTEPAMRSLLDDLLESAAGRPYFDAGAIETLRSDHLEGRANNLYPIAAITTAESWVRRFVD